MKSFEVVSVEIAAEYPKAFGYISDPARLPEWTVAFPLVDGTRAQMRTSRGLVDVELIVEASPEHGTIDWRWTLPGGERGQARSRLVEIAPGRTAYAFVLAPAVEEQAAVLREELKKLRGLLET
ncbi:MAG: hypothetical protein ACRD96_02190 [Bryobacteraceae bacterium]